MGEEAVKRGSTRRYLVIYFFKKQWTAPFYSNFTLLVGSVNYAILYGSLMGPKKQSPSIVLFFRRANWVLSHCLYYNYSQKIKLMHFHTPATIMCLTRETVCAVDCEKVKTGVSFILPLCDCSVFTMKSASHELRDCE